MQIGYDEDQQALRKQLREYYARLLTPEVQAAFDRSGGVGPDMRRIARQMGEDGWLGIGWPKEWEARGRPVMEQFIFFDESMRAGAPVPMLTINTVGSRRRHGRAPRDHESPPGGRLVLEDVVVVTQDLLGATPRERCWNGSSTVQRSPTACSVRDAASQRCGSPPRT